MDRYSRFGLLCALLGICFLSLFFSVCDLGLAVSDRPVLTASYHAAEIAASVDADLVADPPHPELGQIVHLTVSVESRGEFQATGIFELPPELEVVSGDLWWEAELDAGQSYTVDLSARVAARPEGPARFTLDLGTGESHHLLHHFVPVERPYVPDPKAELDPGLVLRRVSSVVDAQDAPAGLSVMRIWDRDDEIALRLILTPAQDLPAASVGLALPPGWSLLEGAEEWTGALEANEPHILPLRVRHPGSASGQLELRLAAGDWQQNFTLELTPLEKLQPAGTETESLRAPADGGTVTVSGYFHYWEVNDSGGTLEAAAYSMVDVYEHDGDGNHDHICSVVTDANGYFACSGYAQDGAGDNILEVFAIANAYHESYGRVTDTGGITYKQQTSIDTTSPPFPVDLGHTSVASSKAGAFHIQKMLAYAYETVKQLGGEAPPGSGDSDWLAVRWPDTDTDNSSEYGNSTLWIEGAGSTDPDEWDKSVILHEYGHYVMDLFAELPPGTVFDYCFGGETGDCGHSWTSQEYEEVAFKEGWANFYQSAVKQTWGLPDPAHYIDGSMDLNMETGCRPDLTFDDPDPILAQIRRECTTSGILYDLLDWNGPSGEDQNGDGIGDGLSFPYTTIHEALSLYDPPCCHDALYNPDAPWDLREYWDGLMPRVGVYEDLVRQIYWEHGVDEDTAPNTPSNPSPANGASNLDPENISALSWSGGDPDDGDWMTYRIYLEAGDTSPDWLYCTTSGMTTCGISDLAHDSQYYWRVAASDRYGKTVTGTVWSFSTMPAPGDGYEPDDTAGTGTWLASGSPQNHSIKPAGDEDWYRFTLGSESGVVLETSGVAGDTEMWLYNAGVSEIDYNDDIGSGNYFSRIERTCGVDPLPAGTYYVKVEEYYNTNEISNYQMSFTNTGSCGGGPTCYSFEASVHPAGTGIINLSPSYNCTGGYTAGTNVQLTADAYHGYTFMGWDGDASSSANPLNLTVNSDMAIAALIGDGYETDNSAGAAITLTPGEAQGHSILPVGDEDWWVFTLDVESAVRLETSGDSGDTCMWLFDDGLTELDYDDDDGGGFFSRIERSCGVNPLPAGTYYVKVDEFNNNDEIENYEIELTDLGTCVEPGKLLLDESHGNWLSLDQTRAQALADLAQGELDWFYVSQWETLFAGEYEWERNADQPLTLALLQNYDALVLPNYDYDRELSAGEELAVRQYVHGGGGLLILGDCGFYNPDPSLSEAFGFDFIPECLFGPAPEYNGNIDLSDFALHPARTGVSSFTLNWAQSMEITGEAEALLFTDGETWRNENEDEDYDESTDTLGPFTVGAAYDQGCGRVIGLGDNSVANSELDWTDNEQLLVAMIRWLTGGQACEFFHVYLPLLVK